MSLSKLEEYRYFSPEITNSHRGLRKGTKGSTTNKSNFVTTPKIAEGEGAIFYPSITILPVADCYQP